jgi:hypothetical protein
MRFGESQLNAKVSLCYVVCSENTFIYLLDSEYNAN